MNRSRVLRLLRLLSTVVTALVAPPAVQATTYLTMSDAALADRAPVVAEVRVAAVEPAGVAGPLPLAGRSDTAAF